MNWVSLIKRDTEIYSMHGLCREYVTTTMHWGPVQKHSATIMLDAGHVQELPDHTRWLDSGHAITAASGFITAVQYICAYSQRAP